MTQDIQQKRDGIDLAVFFQSGDPGGRVVLRSFESTLCEYLLQLLDAQLDDAAALHIRAKAIGLVETLDSMGVKISAANDVAVRQVAQRRVGMGLTTG
jgi:hypothetical protein